MKDYKPLGNCIQPVDKRNTDLLDLPLMGLSVSKVFFPTSANLVGTDMRTYKIALPYESFYKRLFRKYNCLHFNELRK